MNVQMKYSNKIYSLLFLAIVLTFAGCVEFKKVTLYDGYEPIEVPPKPADLSLVVETLIYDDDATDVWGLEKNVCQEAGLSDIAISGKESIKMQWNREAKGCDFAGIGIGWDGWAGKDLTQVMDYAAIQMYVRTIQGRSFSLPMVLTLIDYSDGMGFCYTSNKYFERTAIDEEWQKVIVPLEDFEIQKENLDPSNIKQLQIELQQQGQFYLDDISLIFYEAQPQEPWMVEEVLPSPIQTPIQIFDDAFINDNAWGLITDECQVIELSNAHSTEGEKSIHLKWDNEKGKCSLTAIGASWNKWRPVDLTPILETAAFEFDLKMEKGSASRLPVHIGFEDYERAKTFIELRPDFVSGERYNKSWKKVTVPLNAIPSNIDMTRIKQLYISLDGKGEVYIDNFKLVSINK